MTIFTEYFFLCMTFTYPWFLIGLLGVLIPIAIHLFELRKPQRILFTNVEFIREVKLVTARQRKLKHLLILAARIGAVIALVLLFAQPYIPAPEQQASGNIVRVVVDESPSMQQLGVDDHSIFEDATREADGLPLAFPASARFQLAGASKVAVDAEAYRLQVSALQVSGQAGHAAENLARDEQVLGRQKAPVFVFSDFQKNSFSQQIFATLDSSQQMYLVPIAGKGTANVFVDSVWLDDAFVRANVDAAVHIRLRNGGPVTAVNCPMKVFVGNQQAAAFQLTIPARQTAAALVKVRLTGTNVQRCRVVVEDAPVDFDNTYFFTLRPATPIRIVEIGADALMDQLYRNEPLFFYQQARAQAVNYQRLAEANLILVRGVKAVLPELRDGLRQATERGATVVIIPAADAQRDSYAAMFRELGIGGMQWIEQPAGVKPPQRDIAEPSRQNPFFQDVFAGQNRAAVMPKAAPVLNWSRSGTEVLRLRDGESFLAGFGSGMGMVYVFASPLSAEYTDFARHALFVPVLYRLAMQSYQQEQQPAYRLNERTIGIRLPATLKAAGTTGETVFKLTADSLTYIPAQRVQSGRLLLDIPEAMQRPGFYTLTKDGQPIQQLAFNFDKRESDLASYSAAELKQLIGPNRPNIRVYETGAGKTVAAQYKAARVGVPLWRYCLMAALTCLLAEALLLRLGSRPKAAAVAQAA